MTESKRFIVNVTADGKSIIKFRDKALGKQPPRLASIPKWIHRKPNEPLPPPLPEGKEEVAFLCMLCDDEAERSQIWEPYNKIFNEERYDDGDLKDMGQFLFDKLIGDDAWQEMEKEFASVKPSDTVELALKFDEDVQDLHRFNWELMYVPERFLAHRGVAITRHVERKIQDGPQRFSRPPRVLFVVGTNYTDKRIRPGAEYFALLCKLEAEGLCIHPRVLQLASPEEIRARIKSWGPDLVHFICHGDVDRDGQNRLRGCLQLQTENKKQTTGRFATELLDDLKAGGSFPSIVILSACHSGTVPYSGAAQIGSLAAELVAGGVPVVVGMAGSVSDVACRLFSRRFGEAVIAGESLVAATTEGRRAAFLDRTPQTIDWAFPTLFMGADVEAGWVPVDRKKGDEDAGAVLKDRLDVYGIPRYPVFCARYKFFELFHTLFSKSGRRVLSISTEQNTPGVGRTRLLQELAAHALKEGHVPLLVTDRQSQWEPHNVAQLAVVFLRAVRTARTAFGLPPRLESTLLHMLLSLGEESPPTWLADMNISPQIRFESYLAHLTEKGFSGVLIAESAKPAIREELQTLLDELRQPPSQIQDTGRAVVLLDQVHEYGDAIEPLFRVLIDNFGFGTKKEPVPVVLCYSKGTPADDTLREASEGNSIRLQQEELRPFREDYEDMLAYEQVMLNLDHGNKIVQHLSKSVWSRSDEIEGIEGEALSFAYNPRAKDSVVNEWTGKFRSRIKGMPGLLDTDIMYITIEDALGSPPFNTTAGDDRFLVPADDDIRLRKLRE